MADLYSKSLHEYFTLQLLRLWTHPSGPLLCNVISGLQQNKKTGFCASYPVFQSALLLASERNPLSSPQSSYSLSSTVSAAYSPYSQSSSAEKAETPLSAGSFLRHTCTGSDIFSSSSTVEADPGRYICAAFLFTVAEIRNCFKEKISFQRKKQLFQNRSILFPFTGLSCKKPHSLRLSLYYTCSFICQHCQNRKIRCFLCKIQRNLYLSGTEGGLFRTRKRCRYFYCPHDKQQLRSFGKPTPYNHVFFCFQHRLQPSVL